MARPDRRFHRRPALNDLPALAAFGLVLLFGLAVLCAALWQLARHVDAQRWQPVVAEVVALGADTDRRHRTQRSTGELRYAVNGQTHTTTQLSFAWARDRALDDWWAQIAEGLAAPGERVTVWVNPRDPADAVFERGIRWPELGLMLALGALCTWAGAHFLMAWGAPTAADAVPAFSWRTVGGFGLVGALGLGLALLLWRDGYRIWAALACAPALLTAVGVVNGLKLLLRPPG
jgi:hypothetical protein